LEDHACLIFKLPTDELEKYLNLENTHSQQNISTPNRKLHYPEPFIASLSIIHTDIGFIHILHYNY
jgi:hypothetical protein